MQKKDIYLHYLPPPPVLFFFLWRREGGRLAQELPAYITMRVHAQSAANLSILRWLKEKPKLCVEGRKWPVITCTVLVNYLCACPLTYCCLSPRVLNSNSKRLIMADAVSALLDCQMEQLFLFPFFSSAQNCMLTLLERRSFSLLLLHSFDVLIAMFAPLGTVLALRESLLLHGSLCILGEAV